jgi:hypothetical protein
MQKARDNGSLNDSDQKLIAQNFREFESRGAENRIAKEG